MLDDVRLLAAELAEAEDAVQQVLGVWRCIHGAQACPTGRRLSASAGRNPNRPASDQHLEGRRGKGNQRHRRQIVAS
jgi:hypothetical protein